MFVLSMPVSDTPKSPLVALTWRSMFVMLSKLPNPEKTVPSTVMAAAALQNVYVALGVVSFTNSANLMLLLLKAVIVVVMLKYSP